MTTDTLDTAARQALSSAWAQVDDPQEHDAVDGVHPGLVARPTDTDQPVGQAEQVGIRGFVAQGQPNRSVALRAKWS